MIDDARDRTYEVLSGLALDLVCRIRTASTSAFLASLLVSGLAYESSLSTPLPFANRDSYRIGRESPFQMV